MVDKASSYMNLLVKEAIELRLHANNISIDPALLSPSAPIG
jgi:hypothetical protein